MASKARETRSTTFFFKVPGGSIMILQMCVCPDIYQSKKSQKYTWFTGNHLTALLKQMTDVILARILSDVNTGGIKDDFKDSFKITTDTDSSFYIQYKMKKRTTRQYTVVKQPKSARAEKRNTANENSKEGHSGGGYKSITINPTIVVIASPTDAMVESSMVNTRVQQPASSPVQHISRYFTSSQQESLTNSAVKKQTNLRNIVKKMEVTEDLKDDQPAVPAFARDPCSSRDPSSSRDLCSSRDSGLGDSMTGAPRDTCLSRESGLDKNTDFISSTNVTGTCISTAITSTDDLITCDSTNITCTDSATGSVAKANKCNNLKPMCVKGVRKNSSPTTTCTASTSTCTSTVSTCQNSTSTRQRSRSTCQNSTTTCQSTENTFRDSSRKRPRVEPAPDGSGPGRVADDKDEDEDFIEDKPRVTSKHRHKRRKKGVTQTAGSESDNITGKCTRTKRTRSRDRKRSSSTEENVGDACAQRDNKALLNGNGNGEDQSEGTQQVNVIEDDSEVATNFSGASRTDAITIQDVVPEFTNVKKVADLTADHIEYLVADMQKELKQIFKGKTYCRRHEDYKTGGRTRGDLAFQVRFGLFSEEQIEAIMTALIAMFCSRTPKYLDYVTKVLLPETFVLIYTRIFGGSRDEAELLLIDGEPTLDESQESTTE